MKKIIHRPCEICGNIMDLKVNNQKNSKNYGKIITPHRNKRFCSKKCQIEWQQIVKWEDRIGEDNAKRMRKNASDRVKGDKNPSKNKEVAKKISNSIKKYLKDNPRNGDKNPFYGKSHTDEYKQWAKESREGKWSYSEEGYEKLKKRTPKGENHPNWKGGTSNEPYPFEFDKKLKKYIKERDNYQCAICTKKTQKLSIHHIDYNKSNIVETNLISLCYKCHGLTNYNRNEWELMLNNKIKNMSICHK